MINCIKELVRQKYCQSTKNCLKLKDSGVEFNITGLVDTGLLISFTPTDEVHSRAISNTLGFKKICDKLLFLPADDHIDVYFIEIKTSLHPTSKGIATGACDQILSTVPVLDYLISMARVHYNTQKNVNRYFVVLASKISPKLRKQGVKGKEFLQQPYKGEKFKIIHSVSTIPFAHLK